MASPELQTVNQLLSAVSLTSGSVEEQRATLEAASGEPVAGVHVEPVDAGGVPAEWVHLGEVDQRRVILYLHGGGYAIGSLATHRAHVARLSTVANARVLNVDYRLAPEHPYPAAVDDAVAAYRWLLARGVAPEAIAIAGDSAGGGLTIATLLALRDAGEPLPAAGVGLSPWTDLEVAGDSVATRAERDLMCTPDGLKEMADWYAAGADLRLPTISPVHADLAGLPPLLLHVSDAEILLDDSVRLADRAKAAGVDVTLEIWDDMPHVWHVFAGLLPEADEAMARVGSWLEHAARVSEPVRRAGRGQ